MRRDRLAVGLLLALLLGLGALNAWQWRAGPPLDTDLLALLPAPSRDPLVREAEQRIQASMNHELLVLVGHAERSRARALGEALARRWEASGHFQAVRWQLVPGLAALRRTLDEDRLALLPPAVAHALADDPAGFAEQRLASLLDPFARGPLPTGQDWLGLAAALVEPQPGGERLQADPATGTLWAEDGGRHWLLLRAVTARDAFDLTQAPRIAALLDEAREAVRADGGALRVTGGLPFAAAAQAQASREIALLGGGAAAGVVLLLLLAFRSPWALVAVLPVVAGLLAGSLACVALFGRMHLVTLVLGSSLIGVAIDYPLHLLSKSWALRPWDPHRARRLVLPGLLLSLATSLVGYLALGFAPFPALTQIATFSAAGLLVACPASLLLAPLVRPMRPAPALLHLAQALERQRLAWSARLHPAGLLGLVLLLIVPGLWRLEPHNDVRQWIAPPAALAAEAREVARITGHQPTSQFFLVEAADEEALLRRQAALAARLDPLVRDGRLQGYLALPQRVVSSAGQARLRAALAALPVEGSPWQAAGIPAEALAREREALLALPPRTLDEALASPLAEAWRPLWLGRQANGVAGLVSLRGLADAGALAGVAEGLDGVRLVDRVAELNRLFAATQLHATELKLLSCALILALAASVLGLAGALRVIALPLLASAAALAALGWLGQPLTLLGLFGLLLVSALGVDYAILVREGVGGPAVTLIGTLLAAATAWLSFGLLAFSGTPAIADFGLTVSLGLLFSGLAAPWAARPPAPPALATEAPAR